MVSLDNRLNCKNHPSSNEKMYQKQCRFSSLESEVLIVSLREALFCSRKSFILDEYYDILWILWARESDYFGNPVTRFSSLRFFRFANPDCGKDCIFRSRRNLASKFAQIWLQASHYTRAVEKNHREQSLWTSESEDECNKMEQIYNLIHRRCNTVPLSQKFWSNRPDSA